MSNIQQDNILLQMTGKKSREKDYLFPAFLCEVNVNRYENRIEIVAVL